MKGRHQQPRRCSSHYPSLPQVDVVLKVHMLHLQDIFDIELLSLLHLETLVRCAAAGTGFDH